MEEEEEEDGVWDGGCFVEEEEEEGDGMGGTPVVEEEEIWERLGAIVVVVGCLCWFGWRGVGLSRWIRLKLVQLTTLCKKDSV